MHSLHHHPTARLGHRGNRARHTTQPSHWTCHKNTALLVSLLLSLFPVFPSYIPNPLSAKLTRPLEPFSVREGHGCMIRSSSPKQALGELLLWPNRIEKLTVAFSLSLPNFSLSPQLSPSPLLFLLFAHSLKTIALWTSRILLSPGNISPLKLHRPSTLLPRLCKTRAPVRV